MSAASSWPRAIAVACAAVAALVIAVFVAAPRPVAGHGGATPRPVVLPAPVLEVPRHAPVRVPPIQAVAASTPYAFTLTGPKFTIKAHVCAMPNVVPYDPPGEQHHTVCWVESGFGAAPGTGQRTSYLFGHSWAEDSLEVLNKASEVATREILRGHTAQMRSPEPHSPWGPTTTVRPVHALDGYRLVLRTQAGVLTYVVRRAYGVDKHFLGLVADWSDPSPRNRVVLTTCAELDGVDYDYNVVLDAYLVAAHPFHAAVPKS